jgi:hypothetical protein
MRRKNRTLRVALALMTLVAISLPAYAVEPAPAGKWTFAVRPYLWAPGISGTLKYDIPPTGDGAANVDFASYILQNLNFALMLTAEARKGDWSVLTDVVYLDVESSDSNVKSVSFAGPGGRVEIFAGADLGTTVKLSGVLWELAGACTVARGGNSSLDVLAGFRYLGIEAKTDWQLSGSITDNVSGGGGTFARSGSASSRVDLWDAIVGIRGTVGLGDSRWAIPYYLDVGTGDSALTWQGVAGIEYRYDWGDLQLRALTQRDHDLAYQQRQHLRARSRRELPLLTGRTTGNNSLPPAKPWKQGANRRGDGFPLRSVVPIVVIRKNQEE